MCRGPADSASAVTADVAPATNSAAWGDSMPCRLAFSTMSVAAGRLARPVPNPSREAGRSALSHSAAYRTDRLPGVCTGSCRDGTRGPMPRSPQRDCRRHNHRCRGHARTTVPTVDRRLIQSWLRLPTGRARAASPPWPACPVTAVGPSPERSHLIIGPVPKEGPSSDPAHRPCCSWAWRSVQALSVTKPSSSGTNRTPP